MLYAHSRNADGERHPLDVHLRAVADLAASFAAPFGAGELARWTGQAHDVGKASQAFQDYLAACEREPDKRHKTTDHKGAGAQLAFDGGDYSLAFLIQGHHGGLPDKGTLIAKGKELRVDARVAATIQQARERGLLPSSLEALDYPDFVQDARSQEFFLRMLFSAL
ncbi:MAG TPA: CRISPR-associated endonuclease Cas3'', partial [Thermomicrobiales bacterium]|nr:CRISPR-associated endonuclease Cas3'' [Thermomicrobiales bacterium]